MSSPAIGDDLAVVEDGSGTTQVVDFAAGAASGDRIDVSAFFSSFNQLRAHTAQVGDGVVITLDHNDKLVLADVQLSVLTVDDFLFM